MGAYLVAIHGHVHSATAGSNSSITTVVAQIFTFLFKLSDILDAGAIGDISSISENMDSDALAAVIVSTVHQRKQLISARMHTSVTQEADEVERSSAHP